MAAMTLDDVIKEWRLTPKTYPVYLEGADELSGYLKGRLQCANELESYAARERERLKKLEGLRDIVEKLTAIESKLVSVHVAATANKLAGIHHELDEALSALLADTDYTGAKGEKS